MAAWRAGHHLHAVLAGWTVCQLGAGSRSCELAGSGDGRGDKCPVLGANPAKEHLNQIAFAMGHIGASIERSLHRILELSNFFASNICLLEYRSLAFFDLSIKFSNAQT